MPFQFMIERIVISSSSHTSSFFELIFFKDDNTEKAISMLKMWTKQDTEPTHHIDWGNLNDHKKMETTR